MLSTQKKIFPLRHLRSFVRRGGRGTVAQARAQDVFWPCWGLKIENGMQSFEAVFGRKAPCFLEIGFGSGQSLLAVAKNMPDKNFIGVEAHKPGIGALFLAMQNEALTNLRIFDADVVDVLAKCIPDNSLDGVQIFFPDPWPKRRHHARRLIQSAFIKNLLMKLKVGGLLHLATDWEDYAQHMLRVLSNEKGLKNVAGDNQFGARSLYRPTVTKFEQRAIREGRCVRELQFEKR